MARTQQAAQANITLQEQIEAIHKAKGLVQEDDSKEKIGPSKPHEISHLPMQASSPLMPKPNQPMTLLPRPTPSVSLEEASTSFGRTHHDMSYWTNCSFPCPCLWCCRCHPRFAPRSCRLCRCFLGLPWSAWPLGRFLHPCPKCSLPPASTWCPCPPLRLTSWPPRPPPWRPPLQRGPTL